MTDQRRYHTWFAVPGVVSGERPRPIEAVMLAVVILLGVIATNVLV
jgi:hypothetical protein